MPAGDAGPQIYRELLQGYDKTPGPADSESAKLGGQIRTRALDPRRSNQLCLFRIDRGDGDLRTSCPADVQDEEMSAIAKSMFPEPDVIRPGTLRVMSRSRVTFATRLRPPAYGTRIPAHQARRIVRLHGTYIVRTTDPSHRGDLHSDEDLGPKIFRRLDHTAQPLPFDIKDEVPLARQVAARVSSTWTRGPGGSGPDARGPQAH